MAVLSCAAVSAGAGFWYGYLYLGGTLPAAATLAALDEMLERERAGLEVIKQETLSHMDALGDRLGQMQADVLRLNALGGRLVQMAGLSEDEFDFDNPPAQGGPEPVDVRETTVAELTEEMNHLFSELQDRDRKLTMLEQLIMERDLEEQIMPAGSPVLSGFITSKFGHRKDPINGKGSFHAGVDFAGKRGSPIVAVADGLVIAAENRSGYGKTVEIRHGNGLVTRYAHNQKLVVQVGDLVKKGDVIAKMGSSGRATGPHLHFEVLDGEKRINPMQFAGSKKRPSEG
jgi:murein DD-endopeptidase MepM/ murein hydrolase activator NlpD